MKTHVPRRTAALLFLLAATEGSSCPTDRDKTIFTEDGGHNFIANGGANVKEEIITPDVDPEEPVDVQIVVLRCSRGPDPNNFGFAYYTNGAGRCAEGPREVPLGGELQSTDVDVRLYYECGSLKSDEIRPSLRKTGESRLDGSFSGKADGCIGSDREAFWHVIYERRVPSQHLLFLQNAAFVDGP